MTATLTALPTARAAQLDPQPPERLWLIEGLWLRSAAGILGGPPKCCKTWLGLDMAVSVASGTPCLAGFPVRDPGPALIYLAENQLPVVRQRIDSLCRQRCTPIERLDLHVITAPVLRLDLAEDRRRLRETMRRLTPRLLLLDPLVRLHRLDENSAADVSELLGFLRAVQREFDAAVALVHHASKKQRAQPGQALRGSSDLHAFGDSNAYLARRGKRLTLTIEHRAAKAPDPIELQLVANDDRDVHLRAVRDPGRPAVSPQTALEDGVIQLLAQVKEPMTRAAIRARLRVNNQRLGDALVALGRQGRIRRGAQGWRINDQP